MFAVEALRLCAIIGIAVFHTFSPHAQFVAACLPADPRNCGMITSLTTVPTTLWPLMMATLLGAWGNHVFFMISGFFLIPSAQSRAAKDGYWPVQWKSAIRRALVAGLTVAFYAVLCLLVDRWITPVPAIEHYSRWVLGLEFVWLYCVFVMATPVLGWLVDRMWRLPPHGRRTAWIILLAALVAIYAANGYVALTSAAPGASFSLLDWRKWMSALTYFGSFVLAGFMGMAVRTTRGTQAAAATGGAKANAQTTALDKEVANGFVPRLSRPPHTHWWARRRTWLAAFALCLALSGVMAGIAIAYASTVPLTALSFKSTSLLSFLLAFTAVMAAVFGGGTAAEVMPASAPMRRLGRRLVTTLASGIIGFYIIQSVTADFWEPAFRAIADPFFPHGALWYAVNIALSLGLVLTACTFDVAIRRPLFRALRIGT